MKNGLLLAGLCAVMGIFTIGCGNACDDFADHAEECGFETAEGDSDAECTDEAAELAECLTDQSCDALKDGTGFAECAGGG